MELDTGTTVLQGQSQKRIQYLVKHLRWNVFAEIVNGYKPLTIFAKKFHRGCFNSF